MMILAPQKKKLATLVVERMGKKPGFVQKLGEESAPDGMGEEAEMDDSVGLEACAEDIIKAMESKSTKALALALKDFFIMINDEEPMEEPEYEGAENESEY